ncbi:MAG: folate family ECF transporter S component [Oscillospiraceae bacterium]|jgi:ECF transporter S component (folate family)|nr:folate family ECF transporter S component [Oscillospiraceae bacterium]
MNRVNKSAALYATPFSKDYWKDAAAELRDTRMLVFAALMIALRVALKSLGIPIAADLKINIAFFVNAFGAMVFGPVVAIVAAAISDTLGCLLFPSGAYFFPFIFIEIAGSLIFALFLYRTRVTATRVILSRFCIDFFVNIVMNTPIMWVYYKMVLGKSYTIFQLPRIIKNLALFPLESVLLILFLTVMIPIAYRFHLVYDKGESLRFQKRQIVLLATLFVIGAACVGGYYVYNYNTKNHASSLAPAEIAAMNAALTGDGQAQGLLEEGQIVTVNKVYKKLRGDTTVEFTVYQTSPETDQAAVSGYLEKNAKEDATLTKTGSGSAVLTLGSVESVTGMTVKPVE